MTKKEHQTYLELGKAQSSTLPCSCEHVAIKYGKSMKRMRDTISIVQTLLLEGQSFIDCFIHMTMNRFN